MANNKTVKEEAQATAAAQTLTTKSAAMTGILAAISSMSHEQLMQWYPDAMELANSISDGAAAQNQASIQMKPSAAAGGAIKEEVTTLFEGESLTEDAKVKVSTLIENIVNVRFAVEKQTLEEEYQVKLIEETAKIQEELVEKIDSYATYAAEQWLEKNQVAVESAIKIEKAERILEGIKALVAETNIDVPDEKVDAFESLEHEKNDLETKLNESIVEIVELRKIVQGYGALEVFREVSEGLTPIETEKFRKLVEDVDVDGDLNDLKTKITIIKEAHFKRSAPAKSGLTEEALLTEEEDISKKVQAPISVDPRINKYAEAISRASNNRYVRGPFTGK